MNSTIRNKHGSRDELLRRFEALYPDPASELDFDGEFQLAVAVLLSAQCTDKKVNEVTPELFLQFPDFPSLAGARIASLEKIIRPVNYYRTKAKHLKLLAQKVRDEFGGKLPRSHAELTSLPGVGQKTANVILSELQVTPALPVDTHVFRVSQRLGIARGRNPREIEEALMAAFPPEQWRNLHHWLILHGRRVCKAQRPLCGACALADICPSCEA